MMNLFRQSCKLRTLYSHQQRYCFSAYSELAQSRQDFLKITRNVAIIAHVDHGKTTLVDSLLKFSGVNISQQCAMDSNQLQRQKGITILSKCTSIIYDGHNINIVDTPGHHDFGGQVERVLSMVDGVCLIVCASEGPMTQTKFVLRKALEQKIKPMVVINKADRSTARLEDVNNQIFSLFCDLDCPQDYLQYPTYYASGKNGWAVTDMKHQKNNIECILKGIINHVPPPRINENKSFSMLVTQTHPNTFFGKMVLGKINSGQIEIGKVLSAYNQDGKLLHTGKVTKIIKKAGLSQFDLDKAYAGDIVSIAGFPPAKVTSTIIEDTYPDKVIPSIKIDKALMGVSVSVNTSPFAGKEGSKFTLNELRTRLLQQAENDVALQIDPDKNAKSNSIVVRGRGDLHIGLLLEKIRREGYEFSVTPPQIVYKQHQKTKQILQPIQKIAFEIEDRFANLIMEKMNNRKGLYLNSTQLPHNKVIMEYYCSTRALIGIRTELLGETQGTAIIRSQFHQYVPYLGPIKKNPKGAIISMSQGMTTPYCLKQLQKFGALFIKPGYNVYNGLVIGQHTKQQDVEVNPTKQKKLTNVRTHSHDEKIHLIPPKTMSLEQAICYIRDDQLLEVTPKQIRIRKYHLEQNSRQRARRDKKNEFKQFSGKTI